MELAKALKAILKRIQRQTQMEKASGKQLRAKKFAEYLAKKLDCPQEGLSARPFTVDEAQFRKDVRTAIQHMEATNKVIGSDGIHVEMPKANPDVAAELLTKMWQVIGKTGQVPEGWLEGIVVPLYKGKGANMIPLTRGHSTYYHTSVNLCRRQ